MENHKVKGLRGYSSRNKVIVQRRLNLIKRHRKLETLARYYRRDFSNEKRRGKIFDIITEIFSLNRELLINLFSFNFVQSQARVRLFKGKADYYRKKLIKFLNENSINLEREIARYFRSN